MSKPAPKSVKAKRRTPKKKHRVRPLFLLLSAALLLFIVVGATAVSVSRLDITKLSHPLPEPTYLFDQDGNKISQLSSSKIEPVKIGQIPANLKYAIVATEDRRFFEHSGVDLQSIGRALWRDIRSRGFAEGGSTITQQLAKNLFLQSDKTLSRKLKEAGYALKIDLNYNKDEILELYLNSIYFGEGSWGVQNAAKTYFGKNVSDLSLAECALLAGLPKAPSRINPVKNKEAALDRRNVVLSLLKEQNYISEGDYVSAKAAPIALNPSKKDDLKDKFPSYVDYVIREAEEKFGFTEGQILSEGLQIYTTMNPTVQNAAEDVYREGTLFPESKPDQLIQSGTVILDHHTGGIRAIVGNRNDGIARGFNYATDAVRQPGSSFKPLVVYGPALDKGYTPFSMLYDGVLNINGYQPKDWDMQTRGQVTLEEAVTKSWNIPAVWLLNEIGIDTGMAYAQKAGIPLDKDDRQLGIALGGLSKGVSPLQMAQAFSQYPNGGTMIPAHAIVKITDRSGHVLAEAKPKPVPVTTPQTAYTMTKLLQNVVNSGTGVNARMNRPAAGKTGTTQLPDTPEFQGITGGVSKDAWFVGYTPELTAAVWLGYDKTDKDHYLTTSGSAAPAQIFKEILSRALKDVPVTDFAMPAGYVNPTSAKKEDSDSAAYKGNNKGKGNDKKDDEQGKDDKDHKDNEKNNKDKDNGKGKGKDD